MPWLEAGFYQQSLFPQDWICLLNPEHPRVRDTLSLAQYRTEAHVAIAAGTGAELLETALKAAGVERRVVLALPGFLGLATMVATTDLIATLPRQIGATLARMGGLRMLAPPLAIAGFTVKQHWHGRFHHDAANRRLRGVCWSLFGRSASEPARQSES